MIARTGPGLFLASMLCACAATRPQLIATDLSETPEPSPIVHVPRPTSLPVDPSCPLKPFHNYYRVTSVSEHRRHYLTTFSALVRQYAHYSVAISGGDLKLEDFYWPTRVRVPDDHDPTDPAVDLIRADIARREGDSVGASVQFVGETREVEVQELVPYEDAEGEHLWVSSLGLRLWVDDGLTQVSGISRLTHFVPTQRAEKLEGCGSSSHWVDVAVDRQGNHRLLDVWGPNADVPAHTRESLERAVLAVAAGLLAEAAPTALGELSTQSSATLLPHNVDDTIEISLRLVEDDPSRPPRFGNRRVVDRGGYRMSLGKALQEGGAQRSATFSTVGGELTLRTTMTAAAVAGAPASGRSTLDVAVAFEVSGADRPMRGTLRRRVPVIRDGPRVVPLEHRLRRRERYPRVREFGGWRPRDDVDRLYVTVRLD